MWKTRLKEMMRAFDTVFRPGTATHHRMFNESEHLVLASVQWLRLFVEALGAAVILIGVLATLRVLWITLKADQEASLGKMRVTFARYLTFALELQLAADVLSTSVSPSWDQIGKLAAIAVIRTALNFFLRQEMREEERVAPKPKTPRSRDDDWIHRTG